MVEELSLKVLMELSGERQKELLLEADERCEGLSLSQERLQQPSPFLSPCI